MNNLKENLCSLSFMKWIGLGLIMYLYGVNHINGLAMFQKSIMPHIMVGILS